MTFRNLILIVMYCVLVACACRTSPIPPFRIESIDTAIKASKVSIYELQKNYKAYQGQYVETTGIFYQGFEEFVINGDAFLQAQEEAFWLSLDRNLIIDSASLDKMSGKRVTIKGIIDTTKKGHLASYPASIDKIYFWKEE